MSPSRSAALKLSEAAPLFAALGDETRLHLVTRLGRRHASQPVVRQTSPRGETIFWIGPAGDAREAGPGTDFHATANGQVSMTPLQVDLTEHASLEHWRAWLGGAGA